MTRTKIPLFNTSQDFGLFGTPFLRWHRTWRERAAIRSLQGTLETLDARTLSDLGFDQLKECANHPVPAMPRDLVRAVRAASARRS